MIVYRVKLAHDDLDNWVALKIMMREDTKDSSLDKIFLNESEIMKKLDHPNIIKLLGSSSKSNAIREDGPELPVNYIAMEYAENGEIFEFISESGRFSEPEARFYFHQLIEGLEYMHDKGYYHRDIKPENLLMDEDYNLKIADFGFTTTYQVCNTKKGTYGYM